MPKLETVYRADAVAIGGYFVRPTPMPIESVTAKVPLVGGMATQQRSATRMPFLAFESASVTAFGGVDNEGTARSYAQAVVERLNVLEVVTADRCVATVSSEQRPGEQQTIRIQDARVDGLRVFGRAVEVQFSFRSTSFRHSRTGTASLPITISRSGPFAKRNRFRMITN